MTLPTFNGAWRASNVSLGALPGNPIVKDRSGRCQEDFLIWPEPNPVKVLDLFLGVLSGDLMFCQLVHILTLFLCEK